MRSPYKPIALLVAVTVSMIAPQAQGKEPIKIEDLPKRIVKLVDEYLPGATLTRAKKVDDKGEYDVSSNRSST